MKDINFPEEEREEEDECIHSSSFSSFSCSFGRIQPLLGLMLLQQ